MVPDKPLYTKDDAPSSARDIVLLGINARYHHTSFGLRYLKANLGELESRCEIVETTIRQDIDDIARAALRHQPRVIGLGVYVWNAQRSLEVVTYLKAVAPHVSIVIGGPEVSHEWDEQEIVALSDYTVTGEGEHAFRRLCQKLLSDESPSATVLHGGSIPIEQLELPYHLYTGEDIARRVIYVEASRGCPFRCQFCLSSLDRGLRMVSQERFFAAMDSLIERGAREFKFIDRTFNLRIADAEAILGFFQTRWKPDMTLHFEMVPDRLPTALKDKLAAFPPGSVQLEIGIQTFNPTVGRLIERRQDLVKTAENLQFLRSETGVHIHADLIAGLPGEDISSFADGFDRLVALRPQEIQVGILKRLRGTPIKQHTSSHDMVYHNSAPYEILSTSQLTRAELDHLKRFARFWDLIANSGNFIDTTRIILSQGHSAYRAFSTLTRWLYAHFGRTHHIALNDLAEALLRYLCDECGLATRDVGRGIALDLHRTPGRKTPRFLKPLLDRGWVPPRRQDLGGHLKERQARHVLSGADAA